MAGKVDLDAETSGTMVSALEDAPGGLVPTPDSATSWEPDACFGCPGQPLCQAGKATCWSNWAVQTCNGDGTGFCVDQCPLGAPCVDGACCTPACAGKACGPNGCGGECGVCSSTEICTEGGICTSTQCDVEDATGFVRSIGWWGSGATLVPGGGVAILKDIATIRTFDKDGHVALDLALPPAPEDAWGETAGLVATSDGGFAVAWNQAPPTEKLTTPGVVRVDSAGELVWRKIWPGKDFRLARAIIPTAGGFVVAGHSNSGDQYNPDLWLARCDASGALQWEKTYGAAGQSEGFVAVSPDASDGFGVLGSRNSGQDVVLARVGADGSAPELSKWASPGGSPPSALASLPDGWLVLGGTWLTRLDASGQQAWTQPLAGGYAIAALPGGGAIVAGIHTTLIPGDPPGNGDAATPGTQLQDAWLARADISGTVLWEHSYGGEGSDDVRWVTPHPDGGFLAAGTLLVRTNAEGAAPDCK